MLVEVSHITGKEMVSPFKNQKKEKRVIINIWSQFLDTDNLLRQSILKFI